MGLLSWLSGYDTENADRAAAADAENRRLTAMRTAQGAYTPLEIERSQANWGTDEYLDRAGVDRALGESFDEGWREGRQNVSGFVGGIFRVVGDVLKAVLFGIPLWVWLLAALFLAWRFGLLAKLARKARA